MTEQHLSLNAPDQSAPINHRANRKTKSYSLPKATRPSPTIHPQAFDRFADELKRTALGEQMLVDISRTLTVVCGEMNDVADAEDSIISAENERIAGGGDPVNVKMHDGRARAMPTRYDELANTAQPHLERAITQHEDRIKKHYSLQIRILDKMTEALNHPETSRDTKLMGDIRNHMKDLGKTKSKHFALEQIRKGDMAAIHVIFSSPIYLTGLSEDDLKVLRPMAQKALTPDLHRAFEIGQTMEKSLVLAKKQLADKHSTISKYRMHSQKAATDALNKLKKKG